MEQLTRRNFIATVGMFGLATASGVTLASCAVTKEGEQEQQANAKEGDAKQPQQASSIDVSQNKGIDCPWCGPGSESSDWTATPADIKEIGGCTMPLDELNRRRKLYIDAQTEYTKADGTVVPEIFVKARALLNTYGHGFGNEIHDDSFNWFMNELSEDECQALLEMPWGVRFSALEFSEVSGRTVEECTEICEGLFNKAWLFRASNDNGTHYCQVPIIQGVGEYHCPDVYAGRSTWDDFSGCKGEDYTTTEWASGDLFFHVLPCSPDVVKDGAINQLDDIEKFWATKNKFSLSPCFCRSVTASGVDSMPELPGYPDGDFDLSDVVSPVCGHDMMTCMSCGEEAQFWIDHHVGREITYEEAMERLHKSVEAGHVMECTNTAKAESLCSCHGDCCLFLRGFKAVGNGCRAYRNISHYMLEVDTESCTKCGTCAKRCPMETITMDGEGGLPVVGNVCVSCGQCAYVCPTKSRWLVPKDEGMYAQPLEDLPANSNYLAAGRFEDGLVW